MSVPLVAKNSEIDAADEASSPIDAALSINSSENKALTEQYTEFLARKPVVPEHQKAASEPEQKVEYVRKTLCLLNLKVIRTLCDCSIGRWFNFR